MLDSTVLLLLFCGFFFGNSDTKQKCLESSSEIGSWCMVLCLIPCCMNTKEFCSLGIWPEALWFRLNPHCSSDPSHEWNEGRQQWAPLRSLEDGNKLEKEELKQVWFILFHWNKCVLNAYNVLCTTPGAKETMVNKNGYRPCSHEACCPGEVRKTNERIIKLNTHL